MNSISMYPFRLNPVNNVTPFTYRDGTTYLEILAGLERYVTDTVTPWFYEEIGRIILETETAINTIAEGSAESDRLARELVDKAIQHVNDSVQYINNKTGPAEIQYVTLTRNHTLTIDPLWPDKHPVYVVLTQDSTGGRTVTLADNITGPLDLRTEPGELTEFWMIPHGETWSIYQPASRYPGSPTDMALAGLMANDNSESAAALMERVNRRVDEVTAPALEKVATATERFPGALARWGNALENRKNSPVVWVNLGSSTANGGITDNYGLSWVGRIATNLSGKPHGEAVVPLATSNVRPSAGVAVFNGAVGGTSSATYLTDEKVGIIARLRPQLVTHMIGSNDYADKTPLANYLNNVAWWADKIQAAVPDVVQVFIHQQSRNDIVNPPVSWNQYGNAMRELAKRYAGGVFINASEHFETAGMSPHLMADPLHMNNAGHRILADIVADALGVPILYTPETVYRATGLKTITVAADEILNSWASLTVPAAPFPRELEVSLDAYAYGTGQAGSVGPEFAIRVEYTDGTEIGRAKSTRILNGGVGYAQVYHVSTSYTVDANRDVRFRVELGPNIYMSGNEAYTRFAVKAVPR